MLMLLRSWLIEAGMWTSLITSETRFILTCFETSLWNFYLTLFSRFKHHSHLFRPLIWAALNEHTDTCQVLVSFGANVNIISNVMSDFVWNLFFLHLLVELEWKYSLNSNLLKGEHGCHRDACECWCWCEPSEQRGVFRLAVRLQRWVHRGGQIALVKRGSVERHQQQGEHPPHLLCPRGLHWGRQDAARYWSWCGYLWQCFEIGRCDFYIFVVLKNGNSPLNCAAQKGHPEVAKLLLRSGANADLINKFGDTFLSIFYYFGHLIVDVFFVICKSPLIWGALNAYTEVVEVLIQGGCNVNIQSENGNTALTLAGSKGNVDIIRMLLDNGAETNKVNNVSQPHSLVLSQATLLNFILWFLFLIGWKLCFVVSCT